MVNVFPKDITPWSVQDSNLGPSAPDPDVLITRPHRVYRVLFKCVNSTSRENYEKFTNDVKLPLCLFSVVYCHFATFGRSTVKELLKTEKFRKLTICINI